MSVEWIYVQILFIGSAPGLKIIWNHKKLFKWLFILPVILYNYWLNRVYGQAVLEGIYCTERRDMLEV